MPVSLRLFLSALLIASGCSAPQTNGQAGAIDPDSPAIATLDGEPITLAELDAWIKDQLLEEQLKGKNASAAHEFREERLRQLIDDRLVEAAAARQGVEVEALLEQQRAAASVSDERSAGSPAASTNPACARRVCVEISSASLIERTTRAEGSWRPRSSWLR